MRRPQATVDRGSPRSKPLVAATNGGLAGSVEGREERLLHGMGRVG